MLLDWTGPGLRADKRGAIPDYLAPIAERLGLNRSNWVETVRGFARLFKQAAVPSSSLESFKVSRQVVTHARPPSRKARSETSLRLPGRVRWPIAPTDEFMGV